MIYAWLGVLLHRQARQQIDDKSVKFLPNTRFKNSPCGPAYRTTANRLRPHFNSINDLKGPISESNIVTNAQTGFSRTDGCLRIMHGWWASADIMNALVQIKIYNIVKAMSYDSSSSGSEQEEPKSNKALFSSQAYLTKSIPLLEEWKANTLLSDIDYLRAEASRITPQSQLFLSGHQVRVIAFISALKRELSSILSSYKKIYALANPLATEEELQSVKQLDRRLGELVRYLHIVEGNHSIVFYMNVYEEGVEKIYEILMETPIFCLDMEVIWLILLMPRMFRQEQAKAYFHKSSFAASPLEYAKQISIMRNRFPKAAHILSKLEVEPPKSERDVVSMMKAVVLLNSPTKLQYKLASIIKGLFFSLHYANTLKQRFIRMSFMMYWAGEDEAWDYQQYEQLCVRVAEEVQERPHQLMECFIFMEPECINFENRRRVSQLARIFNSYLDKILQRSTLTTGSTLEASHGFLSLLLTDHNCQLFLHLIVNFQISNKNIYSLNDAVLHELFLAMLDKLKRLYLSMGEDVWPISTNMFTSLTNKFFSRLSDNLLSPLLSMLPQMVQKLSADELPLKIVVSKQGVVSLVKVDRLEYLSVILYYIEDCKQRDEDNYLELPDLYPTDLSTALLFIESLHLKLKHHEPNEEQKGQYVSILEECVKYYKVKPDFSWFKKEYKNDSNEREIEFLFHSEIKCKWASDVLQDILNFRDTQDRDNLKTRFNNGSLDLLLNVVPYLSFAVRGVEEDSLAGFNITELHVFSLLEEMRIQSLQNFQPIEQMSLQEKRTYNALNVSLIFYNNIIKEAPESEVYRSIVSNIIAPWIQYPHLDSNKQFKDTFPRLFKRFVLMDQYFIAGEALINLLIEKSGDNECKADILEKISYFQGYLVRDSIARMPMEMNAELLGQIMSILHDQIDVEILLLLSDVVAFFLDSQQDLEANFTLDLLLDSVVDDEERLRAFLKGFQSRQVSKIRPLIKALTPKIPLLFNKCQYPTISHIIVAFSRFPAQSETDLSIKKDFYQAFTSIQIPQNSPKNQALLLSLFKALIAFANVDSNSNNEFKNNQYQSQFQAFNQMQWQALEKMLESKDINWKNSDDPSHNSEEKNLTDLLALFGSKVSNLIGSKAKAAQHDQKMVEETKDIPLEGRVWRKLVHAFGSLSDFINFGEDPTLYLKGSLESDRKFITNLIVSKNFQSAVFKKLVTRLPLLKECAEELIVKQPEACIASPLLISKMVLINSRYRSQVIEKFILNNMTCLQAGIPIKIYQDYLIKDIKQELQGVDQNFLSQIMLERNSDPKTIQKLRNLFTKVQCIPLKKFERVKLTKEGVENIAQENGEWETESEGNNSDGSSEKSKDERKKVKKDKQSEKVAEDIEMTELAQLANKFNELQLSQSPAQMEEAQLNAAQLQHLQLLEESSHYSNSEGQHEGSEENEDLQEDEDDYNDERAPIAELFYQESQSDRLKKYKELMVLREELNIMMEDDYSSKNMERKLASEGEALRDLMKRMVPIFSEFPEEQRNVIVRKLPLSLHKELISIGFETQVDMEHYEKDRKPVVHMPKFNRNGEEDNENESEGDYANYSEEDEEDESISHDSLSDESIDTENEDSQYDDDNDDYQQSYSGQKEERTIKEELCAEELMSLELPDLKEVNSKIEAETTGDELDAKELEKILHLSLLYLFTVEPLELTSNKSLESYYKEIFRSRTLFKIFNNSLVMLMRLDEGYSDEKAKDVSKYFCRLGLSFKRAINAYTHFIISFLDEPEESSDIKQYIQRNVVDIEPPGDMLPIAEEIMLNNTIQDNFLSFLILYSKFKNKQVHHKLQTVLQRCIELSHLQEEKDSCNTLSAGRAKVLIKHIFKNGNSSKIWQDMEEIFNIKITDSVKFKTCLPLYRAQLLEKLEQVILPKLQPAADEGIPYRLQEKVAEHTLKLYQKQIKHYYFCNKQAIRNLFENKDKDARKLVKRAVEKDKQLAKITELALFYLKSLKDRFGESDEKTFKKIINLPRSIVEASFMYLEKVDGWANNWQSLPKVQQFFQHFKYGQFNFDKLDGPANLILEFLSIPSFCIPILKQTIIPSFIKRQQSLDKKMGEQGEMLKQWNSIISDLPLIFKLPSIPSEADGNSIFLTRQCSFDMAFYQLTSRPILVEFHEEEGSDHGGMVRELFMGWQGEGVGQEYLFLGKILGISFNKGIPYGGKLDYAMAIALTGYLPDLQLLKKVEPHVYDSLTYVINCEDEEEIQDLCLRFVVTHEKYGKVKDYPLIQNGEETHVTLKNKMQYVDLFVHSYFRAGREWELDELKAGFFSFVNQRYASIFHPLELMQKIRGEEVNDYIKLKKKTKYEEGYSENSTSIKWLWEIISKFTQHEMNCFIQFLTGAPKVSIYDSSFSMTIEKTYGEDEERLPVAHTCFNTLDLPEYKTKEILQKKLKQAIFEGNGNFGIL